MVGEIMKFDILPDRRALCAETGDAANPETKTVN
jgi:hypothetical protein